ncbi:hypothetical protein M4R22_10310 [Acidovorax sp. GBBC 3334]|uniref:hypothetical protein n=1 Tax=Acidovorax sp. GBBC 3334 TaxID=2940496 RepID=UPI0023028725|nr:hypothetical protein [Acidovorax sp. GBBC 3334]MDA8455157.1 hypothetical protein [Acidovorax sp. GBBC 3334]
MSEEKMVASGIGKVFEHRKNYIVIGLTGRTGGGCSTAAKILSTQHYNQLNLPSINNPPKSHEDRKQRIISLWADEHWQGFRIINVTAIILSLALREDAADFLDYLTRENSSLSEDKLKNFFVEYSDSARYSLGIANDIENASDDSEIKIAAEFLSVKADNLARDFKSLFGDDLSAYTKTLQGIGNNLRRSGKAFDSEPLPDSLFLMPKTIANAAEVYRREMKLRGVDKKYIVIDALRHPYEIRYLSGRISSFYTVAVSTSDDERRRRLHDLQMNKGQIESLDEMEYPDKISGANDYSILVKQNIQACLELADIYISNLGNGDSSRKELTRQLVRYVSLMQHPGLITPTAEERCMQSAIVAKANSGCISRQVGAVVTDEFYSIKAIGWNDVPQGQVPCLLRNVKHLITGTYDQIAYSGYELENENFQEIVISQYSNKESLNGRNLSYCFKSAYTKTSDKLANNQVHTRSLHAEENAFLQIAKYGGEPLKKGFLFTTASPCELCAKKAYQLGISKIFFIDPYPGIASTHILNSGFNRPKLEIFQGAVRSAYHDLYQPVMAYKDELMSLIAGKEEKIGNNEQLD